MNTDKKIDTFNGNYDDSYKDVLSALSELDDNVSIDYVKENYKYEYTQNSGRRRMDFHPLQHAVKFLQYFIQKKSHYYF